MNLGNSYSHATIKAEQVVHENGITAFPVDPFEIARKLEIEIYPKPQCNAGVSGMLIRRGNLFAIAYATHINNIPFQRFSISHELGHYYLPGHGEAVLDQQGIHESRAGFNSSNPYEIEADHFASGLLMPRKFFIPAVEKAGEGLAAVKSLSTLCNTSLIATAIRLTQCTTDSIAILVSTKDRVDYCFMSESFKELQGITWIAKGSPLPRNSLTREFNETEAKIQNAIQEECNMDLRDWFGGRKRIDMKEEVIGLGGYGKTLTLFNGIYIPEDEEDDEY